LIKTIVRISPPVASGGVVTSSTDGYCLHRAARDGTVDYCDDARAEELNNLRLALATFALRLDAFEMRTNGAALRAGMTPESESGRLISAAGLRGKRDCPSIKSRGNKSDE
jgi:hypothetical protein